MSRIYPTRYPEQYYVRLLFVREVTGLSVADILRRMAGHCLQPHVLNQLIPCNSGGFEQVPAK